MFLYFEKQMIKWRQCCCLISNTSHEFCHLCYIHLVSLKHVQVILCHILWLRHNKFNYVKLILKLTQNVVELGKMQFQHHTQLYQENLNINFINWNCPQHFHFSPLYVKTEKIHPENVIENKNKSTILIDIYLGFPEP